MAQPTPYSRQYNFTNFQSVNPATPLPAAQVDLELNTIKATLDQTLNNLKLIQRDDTALANQSVGKDQLKAEVTIGINPPSPWVTAKAYVLNDTVTINGIFYRCAVAHTSGVFATDLAALDWTLIIDFNAVSFNLPSNIHAAVAKTIPNDADEFPQSDSAAAWGLKKTTWVNFKTQMFAAWGALINTGVGKTTPVNADAFALMDSAAANATKTLTWANLIAAMFSGWGALIAAGTTKATPVGADMVEVADSAAANATKMVTLTNWFAAMFTALGPLIAAATGKSTPVDSDGLLLTDSAAAGAGKLLTWANLKATLSTYFKGLGGLTIAAGDIIYGSGVNTLAKLVIGADGLVLTLSGGLPSWAAASGGMTLLSSGTPANATSTYTVTGMATTYKWFLVYYENVALSAAGRINFNVSSDNGATFDTAATLLMPSATPLSGAFLLFGPGDTVPKTLLAVSSAIVTTQFSTKTSPTNALQFAATNTYTGVGTIIIYGAK